MHSSGDPELGGRFDHELVAELALSTESAALWRFDFASNRLTATSGMGDVLGFQGTEDELHATLNKLIEPLLDAGRTTSSWENFQLEQSVDNPEGTRWVQFRARRSAQDADTMLGIATDVTEQRLASRALADLADRYRLLSELSPDAIVVHEAGKVVYANAATARFLRLRSSAEVLDRLITEFVHPDSVPEMQRRIADLTTPGTASEPADALLLCADGGTLEVESVSVRTTWRGRPAFQVILRDLSAQRAAERTLRFQAALVAHVSDAIIATDGAGVVRSWNPAAEAVYGRTTAEAVGRPVAAMVGAALDPAAVLRAGGVVVDRHHRADGGALDVRVSAAEMGDGHVLMCSDETERRRAEQRFTSVVAALEEGVVVLGPGALIEYANAAAGRILGAQPEDYIGMGSSGWRLYDETGVLLDRESSPVSAVARTGQPQNGQVVRVARPDGSDVWLSLSCRALNPDGEGPYSVVVSFTDITERRAIGERLLYEATHDQLTGLANRALLLQRLTAAVRAPQRSGVTAVLYVDLDKFKVINDSLGHGVGDDVLRVVGARLRHQVRADDLVGRIGGDEFAVVVTGIRHADELRGLSGHLHRSLAQPIAVAGRRLHVNASIGIVLTSPDDPRSAEELLRDADVAMYQAKIQGRGRFEFFDVELRERIQRRMQLEQDLRAALTNGRLRMAYQPVVDVRRYEVVGVEALLRWSEPGQGGISPAEFIPVAEESELINLIGAYTLQTATTEMAGWRTDHDRDIDVAVNLSARQLDDPDLVSIVDKSLRAAQLPADRLCLEITESALMRDPGVAHQKLTMLRELGVRLAIDDFGTGYSSLAQIRRLPVDTLKIDQSFVNGMEDSRDARVIVTSIIVMAHAVDLSVIAEGVENARQLELLQELGCDQVQGFYLGRPVGPDELSGDLAQRD